MTKEEIVVNGDKPVIIIGGGVAGITLAHALVERSYNVLLIDGSSNVSLHASAAAAGCMLRDGCSLGRYDWTQAMRNLIPKGPFKTLWYAAMDKLGFETELSHEDRTMKRAVEDFPFFRVRPTRLIEPHFFRWMWTFAKFNASSKEKVANDNAEMLRFCDWSITKLGETIKNEKLDCNYHHSNAVSLYETQGELSRGMVPDPQLVPSKEVWTASEIPKQVPCIAESKIEWAGASHTVSEMADCHLFTIGLANRLKNRVDFLMGEKVVGFTTKRSGGTLTVSSVETQNHSIVAVKKDGSPIPVVVAVGAWAPFLCAKLGYFVPVYPFKGYDIVVDVSKKKECAPQGILTDGKLYAVRLGNRLRIASMGELAGWDSRPYAGSYKLIAARAKALFTGLEEEIDRAPFLAGFRPVVSNGILLAGLLPGTANAFVTAGPGFNGWKTSVGASELLARSIDASTYGKDVVKTLQEGVDFDASLVLPTGRAKQAPIFCKLCTWWWRAFSTTRGNVIE